MVGWAGGLEGEEGGKGSWPKRMEKGGFSIYDKGFEIDPDRY
jgi:hypothetical protein